MATPADIIHRFHPLISQRYKWLVWIAVAGLILSLSLSIGLRQHLFIRVLGASCSALFLIAVLNLFQHRASMLRCLMINVSNPKQGLVNLLNARIHQWERSLQVRLIAGTLLGLTMLFLMFLFRENPWSRIVAGWFVAYILAVMLWGWLLFTEQILLHDLHRIDHQDSESSE